RQKDRFEEVARLLEKSCVPFMRRSTLNSRSSVVLVDTIGELGAVWGLADVAFVGGSLDGQRGGQNMIEPAAYGAAGRSGTHVRTVRGPGARVPASGAAAQVADAAALEVAVQRLLADVTQRECLGAAARELVRRQQGATARTVALLGGLVAPQR